MAGEVTGIAGIPRRLYSARMRMSADRGTPVTQAEIGRAVGVTEGQIGHWEKGRQRPDLEMIDRLATALGVRPWWIAYGIEWEEAADVATPAPRLGPSIIQENDDAIFEEPNVPEKREPKKRKRGA